MTSEKFVAFITKLLEKTKDLGVKWKRYTPDPRFEDWASGLRSFSCRAGKMKIDMIANEDFERIQFDIQYDPGLPPVSWSPESDEEQQISVRLANYVYNLFPNLENSIDDFLKNY